MLTINELPQTLLAGVRATFDEGRLIYKPTAAAFVQPIESTLLIENYTIYGSHRGPQLFEGEARFSKIKEYKYALANLQYYDAIEVDYELLKYAQNGKIADKARNFGFEWERGKDKQALTTVNFGATAVGYDGTPFFGASHLDLDSGVQSNIVTGASSLDETTLRVMLANMSQFKDDRGEVIGRKPTHILVRTGSAEHIQALKLANSEYTVTGSNFASNPFRGALEVIDSPYLASAVKFVGLDLSGVNRPIVRQESGEMIFTAQERDSEWFQVHKQYRYAVHQDWAYGYNDWRMAYMQI